MASELGISTLTITFAKTNCPSIEVAPAALSVTVSGNQLMDNVQAVTSTEVAIALGDVAPGGYWFVQNMDATNYVEIRASSGGTDLIKLLAGEWAIFRTSADATAPYAIANTAACNVRFLRFDV